MTAIAVVTACSRSKAVELGVQTLETSICVELFSSLQTLFHFLHTAMTVLLALVIVVVLAHMLKLPHCSC